MTEPAGFGLYIHWPYCARICPYCDFNVYRARGADEDLLEAILADLSAHGERLGKRPLDTVYFGGGTPSLLEPRAIERLIGKAEKRFGLAAGAEISLEANPEDRERFADLVSAGINRLSLGVQSLKDDALKALGRAHDRAGAIAAVAAAAETGARVSLDLIYARQGQGLAPWAEELAEALALPAEHFSLYQLTIKPDTAFARAQARGALIPPPDDEAADFFEATQAQCAAAGAPAYEISNYARSAEGQSRHNLIYWRGGEWLGLGPGAHGRVSLDGVRTATIAHRTPKEYIDAVAAAGIGWAETETLAPQADGEERLIMGLRLVEGITRGPIERRLGRPLNAGMIEMLRKEGLLVADRDRVALTQAGRLLADRIAMELCG